MPPTELLPLQPEAHEFFPQGVQLRAYPGLALSNTQVKIKIGALESGMALNFLPIIGNVHLFIFGN